MIDKDATITVDVVNKYFNNHYTSIRRCEQIKLRDAYLGKYDILNVEKPDYKPNNKAVNNFGKVIVDTFSGYFDGKPLNVISQNEAVQKAVDNFNRSNVTEFKDYELIKTMAIFGNCYELIYQNEEGETKNAILDPLDAFVVYDTTVEHAPVFAMVYRIDEENVLTGELYTKDKVYSVYGEEYEISSIIELGTNEYYQIPLNEYCFNTERQGIFENVLSLINLYNKTESEKANDIEYFADSYLGIFGVDIYKPGEDQDAAVADFIKGIRDNRVFVVQAQDTGQGSVKPEAKFLSKPDGDVSQENMLNRLKKDIFQQAMVVDVSDDEFKTASGIALKWKLQPMSNLAVTVKRNMTLSLKHRYELVFSFAKNISPTLANEWKNLEIRYYENIPFDAKDMAETLTEFGVQVSDETALVYAGVENPQEEIKRIEEEEQRDRNMYLLDKEKASANEE